MHWIKEECACGKEAREMVKKGVEVVKVDEFKYLASTVQSNRQHTRGVKKRVQTGWSGWR